MKTRISTTIVALFCFILGVQAQSVLETAVFEAPQKLIRPTGEWVNIRTRPSTSAPKAKDPWGYDMGAGKHTLYVVEEENTGWYRIGKDQWISKSVAKPAKRQPITDQMMNRYFGWSEGYDSYAEWTISPVGKKGFYLFFTQSDGLPQLRLGRLVGNVLVFKYMVQLQALIISEAPEDANKFNLASDTYDGDLRYTLTIGSRFVREMKHGQLTENLINLELFNDKVLERLFKDKIEKNETEYLYITSDLLSGEYEEYELG